MSSSLYRRAVRTMAPSRAEMARRMAPYLERDRIARDQVRAAIEAGADPETLYRSAWAEQGDGDAMRGARQTALLGVLRRGMAALD